MEHIGDGRMGGRRIFESHCEQSARNAVQVGLEWEGYGIVSNEAVQISLE